MAEEKKESEKTQESKSLAMGDLRNLILDTVKDVMKGVTPEPKTDEPVSRREGTRSTSIQEAVQAEIQKIQQKEAEETRQAKLDEELKHLREATAEKPPVERRRVHKVMGWGE
jgi:hypothetical protein